MESTARIFARAKARVGNHCPAASRRLQSESQANQYFVSEVAAEAVLSGTHDRLLFQVHKDLERAARMRSDFLLKETRFPDDNAAESNPGARRVLLERLAQIDRDYGSSVQTGHIGDLMWHSMIRILFMYALLNPSVGYIQGMHEVLYVLLSVLSSGATPSPDAPPPGSEEGEILCIGCAASVEADAFWCFSLLVGELYELYDFGGHDGDTIKAMRSLASPSSHGHENGMVQALSRFSKQLEMLDPELHAYLAAHSAHPRLPYYSFRWLACLYAADFDLPVVTQFWDVLLSRQYERRVQSNGSTNEKIAFLIDIGCALLLQARAELFAPKETADGEKDVFGNTMGLLGAYDLKNAAHTLAIAQQIQRRRALTALHSQELPRDGSSRRVPLQARLRGLANEARTASASPRTSSSSKPDTQPAPQRSATWNTTESPLPLFQRYAEVIQDSNTAASIAKASTNLAAKAISWRNASGPEAPQRTPTKDVCEVPELPIPSVIDSPDDLDSFRGPHGAKGFGYQLRHRDMTASPDASTDDSFANLSSGTQLVLPSMRAAARTGIMSPKSDENRVLGTPRPLLLSNSSRRASTRSQSSNPYSSPLLNKSLPPINREVRINSQEEPLPKPAAPIHSSLRISPPLFRRDSTSMTPPLSTSSRSSAQMTPGGPLSSMSQSSPHAVEHLDALIEQMQQSDLVSNNQLA